MFYDTPVSREFKKILLICFGGLGDVILFFPVIKVLRDIYPKSEIVLVVEPRSKIVAEKNPFVNKVITFDLKNKPKFGDYVEFIKKLKNEKLDLAISLGSSPLVPILLYLSGAKFRVGYDTNKLTFLYTKKVTLNKNQYAGRMYFELLKGIGINTDMLDAKPEIIIPKNELEWGENWFKTKNLDSNEFKKVIIHPGASNISKQKNIIKTWEKEKWVKLVNLLTNKNIKVVLAGGPDDKDDIDYISKNIANSEHFINAYGETKNLDQLSALIKQADLLVCVDSAPLNLCVGINKECVAIFGPTNENKILPPDEKFTAVRESLDCTPCLWDKRITTCEALTCIKNLQVNKVFEQIAKKLNINSEILI